MEGKEAIEERATSIQNAAEARMVLAIYQELRSRYSHLSSSNQIAVISPYKAQVLHGWLPTSFPGSPLSHDGVLRSKTSVACCCRSLYALASLSPSMPLRRIIWQSITRCNAKCRWLCYGDCLKSYLGEKARQLVDVSTIDGFQVCLLA